jgi:lysophospholipase L1-like esterase
MAFGGVLLLSYIFGASASLAASGSGWAASWATPISGEFKKLILPPGVPVAYAATIKALFGQPEFDFALPNGQAADQTFRMIVKPELWGDTMRIRLSNTFGDKDLAIASASIGLQEYAGVVVPGTNTRLTFSGKPNATIPVGGQLFSDPVHLKFVTPAAISHLEGRNLAVSFAVEGTSGVLSAHFGHSNSYLTNPHAGDHTMDEGDLAFPNATTSYFQLSELDVMAPADTIVICALGDSITDTATSTDGHDGWPEDLSQRLHAAYGDRISVVNMGIGGNTVVARQTGATTVEPAVDRLNRDVLGISGLTTVIWLEGINDLGTGQLPPEPIMEAYRQVVGRLHTRGVAVMGATLTSSLWPEPNYDNALAGPVLAALYGKPQTNAYRLQLNDFIRKSGTFDGVADMASVTDDPATGALFKNFQNGDYLHPNRAGHQAMAGAIDLRNLIELRKTK